MELRKKIKDFLANKPDWEVFVGIYVKTIGTKYVHIVNTWGTTTVSKIPLKEFYDMYCQNKPAILHL